MLFGCILMFIALLCFWLRLDFRELLLVWFLIGVGWSAVQTPAGRVVNRSSAQRDRASYFSAQFSLSHACWLLMYPLVGSLGATVGLETTALVLSVVVLVSAIAASLMWPADDPEAIVHSHPLIQHTHQHRRDDHHRHDDVDEVHEHEHEHTAVTHSHPFVIDDHHPSWPS